MDIVADHLGREFPTRSEPLRILRDVHFALTSGDGMVIMGPSGSGKSTLLQILGTLDRPTSGHVRLGGEDPFQRSETGLARFRAEKLGFVFQEHRLLPHLTALENVLIPGLAGGPLSDSTRKRGLHLLERVGLEERLHHFPAELSGGERQRVALARALVNQPAVLLADEPTGSLDAGTASRVADLIWELQREERVSLILVTHSQELASRAVQVRHLQEGCLV
ncbi:MAG TPA: ABC transporter ATP-binding protein [Pirellulaceae bacterium]